MSWKRRLEGKKVLIVDGGWGTELVQRGLGPGEVPEAWNLARREDVLAVASSYVQAGAEMILTNTFGGTRMKLAKGGLDSKTEEINRLGAEISKKAAGDRALSDDECVYDAGCRFRSGLYPGFCASAAMDGSGHEGGALAEGSGPRPHSPCPPRRRAGAAARWQHRRRRRTSWDASACPGRRHRDAP